MSRPKPRVVHVYKDFWPPVEGGIERIIHHMARGCSGEFDVRVIAASRDGQGHEREIEGEGGHPIRITEVPCARRLFSTPLAPGFKDALAQSGADLFHFHVPHPTGEVAYLMAGLKTPAVATYHSDVVRQRAAMVVYGPFFRRFLSRMSVIMPTSERYLQTSGWLRPWREKCRVVPLGYPLEDYADSPIVRRHAAELKIRFGDFVLFLGCLRAYKGLEWLIRATAQLNPRRRVVIAGDGPMRPALEELIERYRLFDRVTLLGRVSEAEAVDLLHAAAIFVLPAHLRSEAFGLCQIEAMACGCPVISTDLPTGVPEVNQHGVTGLVVPPRDETALAAAINQLMRDPAARAQMGQAGQARAHQLYHARVMCENVRQVYRQALGM